MKKILLSLLLTASASLAVQAQDTLTNGGFENWSGGRPIGWTLLSGQLSQVSQLQYTINVNGQPQQRTRPVYNGRFAASLGATIQGQTAQLGILRQQIPLTGKPTILSLSYGTFNSANIASGLTVVMYNSTSRDTALNVRATLQNSVFTAEGDAIEPWRAANLNFTNFYNDTMDAPDSAIITIFSAFAFNGQPTAAELQGSRLFIQYMAFRETDYVSINDAANPITAGVTVYPNPAQGVANISYELNNSSNIRISLMDMQGREVRVVKEGNQVAGKHNEQFDVTGLQAGMYLYRVNAGGQVATGRLMVK